MIRIVSDSTCDLSPALCERYGVSILPLHVYLGEEEYLDGVNVTPDELYRWSDANKTTPRTSAPSIEDAVELLRPMIENGDEVIAFSISASMSASYRVLLLAAEELAAEDRVEVIDSGNLSTGIGLLVIRAAEYAAQGLPLHEAAEKVRALVPQVRASFVVDTLTYLHRGGRCGSVAAFAGSALRLHPRIYVKDGAMGAGKKYRGKYAGIVLSYAKDMEADLLTAETDRVFITHSGIDTSVIENVKAYLEGLHRFDEILITRAGSVVSSHCGPGTLGVLFIAGGEGKS